MIPEIVSLDQGQNGTFTLTFFDSRNTKRAAAELLCLEKEEPDAEPSTVKGMEHLLPPGLLISLPPGLENVTAHSMDVMFPPGLEKDLWLDADLEKNKDFLSMAMRNPLPPGGDDEDDPAEVAKAALAARLAVVRSFEAYSKEQQQIGCGYGAYGGACPQLPIAPLPRLPKKSAKLAPEAKPAASTAPSMPKSPLSLGAGPRYRNDLRLAELNWSELMSGHETRTTLQLRCLPGYLCAEDAFKLALSSADLEQFVNCFRVFPGQGNKRPGSALVNASSAAGVVAVAKYFHGRQWRRSMPVAVSFAALQGSEEIRTAFPAKPRETWSTSSSSSHALSPSASRARNTKSALANRPMRIDVAASTIFEDQGVSEVSTEADDDVEPIVLPMRIHIA
mmetsp:Transcript_146923/g.469487  ORF Transcript_146923/g.469487 Transcript_146923/m.469487 type:complete len:392 (+) Transcript_146923:87-1262(+)